MSLSQPHPAAMLRGAALAASMLPSLLMAQEAAPVAPPASAAPAASAPAGTEAPPAGVADGGDAGAAEGHPGDPFEGFNRKTFAFNESLDRNVLRPVAEGYRKVVPEVVRTGVTNVFGNFSDAWSAVNQLLQGKLQYSLEMGMRVGMNTFFGLGGLIDVASDAGLEKRSEDLGQTLGRWGFGPGPYLVLPVLGPSDLRDTIALPADAYATPASVVDDTGAQVGIVLLNVVNTRANLLGATNMVDSIALDKYTFIRDAYLARRRSLVYDGDSPDDSPAPDDGLPPAAAPAATGSDTK